MNDKLLADLLQLISERPRLLNDVIDDLRHGDPRIANRRWRGVPRAYAVEDALRGVEGVFIRSREHGAGLAVYVATAAFSEVETRHGMKLVHL